MTEQKNSQYTQYLPRIYQKRADETDSDYFLGRFLKAFESVLTGTPEKEGDVLGIEALLDRFDQYLDPSRTPAHFLSWLAGWVGLELEDTVSFYGEKDNAEKNDVHTQILPLDEVRQSINRNMIGTEVQIYKMLGTYEGMLKHLQTYAGEESTITIDEFEELAKIGEIGRVGVGTMVGRTKPCFFSVHALIPAYNKSVLQNKVGIIRKIIEKEKPIYANYILTTEVPSMRVGVYSRIGRETLVGGMAQ
jgi:phage tail-like protein